GGVAADHHRQLQLVETLPEHRHADDPRGVPQHEPDLLGGDLLGGEDQVAFVLAVGVVDDDDHLPPPDGLGELFDGGEFAHRPAPSMRSTYLAITSTSMLTRSPGFRAPSVVTASVWGIRATSNPVSVTPATVRLTPSTATDPFSAMERRRGAGTEIVMRRPSPSATTDSMVPTPSTWPWTMWPSNRPEAATGRSRLTESPGWRAPRLVRSRVSPTAWKER